jgi:hypothetical protein
VSKSFLSRLPVVGSIPRKYGLILGVGFGATLVAAIGFLFGPGEQAAKSAAAGLTPRKVDSTVGGPGSPQYNQMIDELNRAGASLAREKGESFVDTPIGEQKLPPAASPKEATAPVQRPQRLQMAPQPLAKAPERVAPGNLEPDLTAALSESLTGDLKGVVNPSPGAWVTASIKLPAPAAAAAAGSSQPEVNLPPTGSLMYAVTVSGVNSDVPSPVVAVVAEGEFKGSKLLGGFQLQGGLLSIAFSQIILPGGKAIGIKAVAVDARTNSPAVPGQVNTHFWERWGALMAASFLEGFGEAVSNRGTSVHAYGDVVVAVRDAVSARDISLEALGRVGSRAAGQLEKGFDRPPTVIVPAGSPIGVLMMGSEG